MVSTISINKNQYLFNGFTRKIVLPISICLYQFCCQPNNPFSLITADSCEDIAKNYLPYFAVKFRPYRISSSLKEKTELSIPNRIKYFSAQNHNMYPIQK